MPENKPFFTNERREANMQIVVKQLESLKDMDFNSLIFTFADIIQSGFLNGLMLGKSREEREKAQEDIVKLRNKIIDTLNDNSENMMYDMIVLTDLIMDAVESAMQKALKDSQE